MNYLNYKNVLYEHQTSFRFKNTTIHLILHSLNNCAGAIYTKLKQVTLSVFCDSSKAFDVISHENLTKNAGK